MPEHILIGVDIGGTKTAVVAGTDAPAIIAREVFPTEPRLGPDQAIDRIVEAIGRVLAAVGAVERSAAGESSPDARAAARSDGQLSAPGPGSRSAARAGAARSTSRRASPSAAALPAAIGVSCGGPLDSGRGVILGPPNLPGWDEVPIVELLAARTGLPVFLQNDADACALAEHRWGAGRGCRNMVFLTFGTGMGAGLILDGRLYSGTNGMAGEVGHVRLAEAGPIGYGKAGSFEGYCSGGGIAQLAQQEVVRRLAAGETIGFCRSADDAARLTTRDVAAAAEAGDPVALFIVELSAQYLGKGLAILIDILNPERIVLGSIFVRAERLFRFRAEQVIESEALARSRSVCSIVPAALGEHLGDYGSLCVAMEGIAGAGIGATAASDG